MHDGCKSLHGFVHGIERVMFHGHLDYFLKSPLGGRPDTKLGDHGIRTLVIVDLFHFIMRDGSA